MTTKQKAKKAEYQRNRRAKIKAEKEAQRNAEYHQAMHQMMLPPSELFIVVHTNGERCNLGSGIENQGIDESQGEAEDHAKQPCGPHAILKYVLASPASQRS